MRNPRLHEVLPANSRREHSLTIVARNTNPDALDFLNSKISPTTAAKSTPIESSLKLSGWIQNNFSLWTSLPIS